MHGHPRSQVREVLEEKETIARRLLARGLTTAQICGQLRCSRYFVRRVMQGMQDELHQQPRPE